jgi:hypothetical protein
VIEESPQVKTPVAELAPSNANARFVTIVILISFSLLVPLYLVCMVR